MEYFKLLVSHGLSPEFVILRDGIALYRNWYMLLRKKPGFCFSKALKHKVELYMVLINPILGWLMPLDPIIRISHISFSHSTYCKALYYWNSSWAEIKISRKECWLHTHY